MKRNSVGLRLMSSTILAVSIIAIGFGAIAWSVIAGQVRHEAAAQAALRASAVLSRLDTIQKLAPAQVESGMQILLEQSSSTGTAQVRGTVELNGKPVPDLRFGDQSQVLDFTIVDHVKSMVGGTATIFARDGGGFIRISTNVLKPDGTRAVGTMLDPKGQAYAALSQGKIFTGVVDILGVPYIAAYVPITNSDSVPIGALYTGYRLDSLAALGKGIEEATLVDHGFLALIKSSGGIVFHGRQVTPEQIQALRAHPEGWVVHEDRFPEWGYTVLSAYPVADVTRQLLKTFGWLAGALFVLLALIVVLQFFLVDRQVLKPVRELTARLASADLNTLIETDRGDEIGQLAHHFNQFVLRLRHTLLKVRDGSAATSAKSVEIRSVGQSAVNGMEEQRQLAESGSEAIAHLSSGIAAISSHTRDASAQARAAADAAREGSVIVVSATQQIDALSEETRQSAVQVATLSEKAEQIGSIVGVIEEIAAGTNLLALNASIEAARAGEHGRGFAVVAGEVRRLSERTAEATRQVSDLVSGIATQTESTATGIRSANVRATAGAEAVARLKDTFERIAGLVIEVDSRVAQIAHAADRESEATKHVSDTVLRVASSAQSSASGAGRVVDATIELQGTAKSLEQLVGQFALQALPQDAMTSIAGS